MYVSMSSERKQDSQEIRNTESEVVHADFLAVSAARVSEREKESERERERACE